jgi:phage terminase large subunit
VNARLLKEAKAVRLTRRSERAGSVGTGLISYRNDPVGFCVDVLGVEPWEKQRQILYALVDQSRVSVRSCNNAGKTICAAWASLWWLYTRPNSIVITTAPTGAQVKNLLWRRLRGAHAAAKVPLMGKPLTQTLELGPEWYALGMSTDEEVNFQGPHSAAGVLMVGDEASGLEDWLFAAMKGSMTEEGSRMLLIGNPNSASGFFYESQINWPPAQRFHISAFDVPPHVLRPSWREEMLQDAGGNVNDLDYRVRVLGEPPDQGPNSLIAYSWIVAAQNRTLEPVGEIEMGADIARFGSDETCYYVRQGKVVLHGDGWRGQDTMASAGRLAKACRQWQPTVVKVDDIGVGGGVVDRLREQGYPVQGVNCGQAAVDREKYYNRRSEMFAGLADRFRTGEISISADDAVLARQLVALLKQYTSRGQMRLEGKDDLRKRLPKIGSPDRADALALTFAVIPSGFVPWVGGVDGSDRYAYGSRSS